MSLTELIAARNRELNIPVPIVDGDGETVDVRVLLWDESPEDGLARLLKQAEAAGEADPKHKCGRWQSALKSLSLELWIALAKVGESIPLPMIGSSLTLDRLLEDWSALIVLASGGRVVVALLPEELMGHDGCESCAKKLSIDAN